ncbi:DEAD/DEAH box helicase [Shewanella xiamenensis]|uniref:DEAD/DEAH box helicase n=1 Tax=Shewanella xiamenensis TaxID=332186 RepID=UPI0035B712F1
MTKMIPELSEVQLNELPSQAEAKVYRALRDKLPNDYVVFFQVGWILRREEEQAKDGETDFLICHPDHGYLCVEVKGGGVGFDAVSGEWFSVDRRHQKHTINNPIGQALKAKYSIRSKLNEHPRWQELSLGNVLRGHAVFFPDVGDTHVLSRPDMPEALIGSAKTLQDPKSWIDRIFVYWSNDVESFTPIGRRGIDVIRDVFARSFVVTPLVASRLADQEARRLVLTKDQMRLLDFLRSHRRAAISGGAGTGKTVLALEKARRLASDGFRTLLTCYNRQLADHLSSLCYGTQNLDVMSFHQLCHRQVEGAKRASGRDLVSEAKVTYPGKDLYEVQLPNALGYSLEVLPDRYDAIVCDEGQDFREEFWVPLELLLTDYESSPFYVFFDDNQNLYARAATFPIREEAFSLATNCRNTAQIHDAAYKHYKGIPVTPPDIQGDDVKYVESANRDSQANKINSLLINLIVKQGVSPGDITVLIADALHKAEYYSCLQRLPLPKPATWLQEGVRSTTTVLLDTIQRFKGLESPIVILWGLDSIGPIQKHELLYVGLSRAKSVVILVGNSDTGCRLKQLLELSFGK